jgi:carbon monoxide dehydrogenase subunit G
MVMKVNAAIHAPRNKVCEFLTESIQIGRCAPGVVKIEIVEPDKNYRKRDQLPCTGRADFHPICN